MMVSMVIMMVIMMERIKKDIKKYINYKSLKNSNRFYKYKVAIFLCAFPFVLNPIRFTSYKIYEIKKYYLS